MADTSFDDVFTQVAGRLGGIQPLLDTFFGFLCRKTDFYVQFDPAVHKNANMGFPPGVAEKMLLDSFKKYPYRQIATQSKNTTQQTDVSSSKPIASGKKASEKTGETFSASTSSSSTVPAANSTSSLPPPPKESKTKPPTMQLTESGKQIPIGNGGYTENYYWTQTVNELTVYVDVPNGTRGKEVDCVMKPRSLSLSLKGRNDGPILSGTLEDIVKLDESMWTLASDDNSTQVIITLDKQRKTWWKHVLVGDPEIDTSKVDSQQKMDEYDEETQATIRKLMFDQKQRRMGLPTSEDIKTESIFEKAKNAPGSPFLNQPFDHEGKI